MQGEPGALEPGGHQGRLGDAPSSLNSGGANCYTGPAGFAVTHATAELVGRVAGSRSRRRPGLLDRPDRPAERPGRPAGRRARRGRQSLDADGGPAAAEAIMTTDSVPKQAVVDAATAGPSAAWPRARACSPRRSPRCSSSSPRTPCSTPTRPTRPCARPPRTTFDRLDSDGCQSTNDTVLLMASGASGERPDPAAFAESLREVCHDLALQLLADAEGADHEITIDVVNAASEDDAVEVGRSIARSNLFKCAIFGKDPNWGRILASVGTTDAAFDPADLDVALNGVWVCRNSGPGEPPTSVSLEERAVTVHGRPQGRRRHARRSGPTTSPTPTSTRTRPTRHERDDERTRRHRTRPTTSRSIPTTGTARRRGSRPPTRPPRSPRPCRG